MVVPFLDSERLLLASEWAQFSVCVFIIIVIGLLVKRLTQPNEQPPVLPLRRDFTLAELREYDGRHLGADGQRILVALNGRVYDVSSERDHYMPGGRYASYAGRDCSRHLATYDLNPINSNEFDYDDLSSVSQMERESIEEWEIVFKKKYDLVGDLVPCAAKGRKPHTMSPASVMASANVWEPCHLHRPQQQPQQQQQQLQHQQQQEQLEQENTKTKPQLTNDLTAKGPKQQHEVAIQFELEQHQQQQQEENSSAEC